MRKFCFVFFICILSFLAIPLQAAPRKKVPFKTEKEAKSYLRTCYKRGWCLYKHKNWREASDYFEKIIYFFPCSAEAIEVTYHLGVCYFEMKEYDFANEQFSNYIKLAENPAFFEEAIQYKFCIAENLRKGHKKRPFTLRYLPKWASGKDLALTVYDEIIAAVCNHDLTIKALNAKASLLKQMKEYRAAIETYQMIIKRFPDHEIVSRCYFNIADAYYLWAKCDLQNPDILALAELNVNKFQEQFPREENIEIANQKVQAIKELYAKNLCDLGLFYERIGQPGAAAIYYQTSIAKFPDTYIGRFCRSRLLALGCDVPSIEESYEEKCEISEAVSSESFQNTAESATIESVEKEEHLLESPNAPVFFNE
jgi:outer membrane protein assembly factor BamD (BamD/ComL family)